MCVFFRSGSSSRYPPAQPPPGPAATAVSRRSPAHPSRIQAVNRGSDMRRAVRVIDREAGDIHLVAGIDLAVIGGRVEFLDAHLSSKARPGRGRHTLLAPEAPVIDMADGATASLRGRIDEGNCGGVTPMKVGVVKEVPRASGG